ncbi:MAG: 16S rRNA (cytidine(1402)-2'-O)-methyltransferase [Candidatus Eisenbacteria bacterium]|nr:16S rRNA (cytidine(1402)-2'-O)-methyltransferase [Candidatus Eisenbacteria bacterium]
MATLYVIATPIGNLEDLTARAARILGEVTVLACEDTRVTGRLLARHGIARPAHRIAYHEHNELRAGRRILRSLAQGHSVGLCSNAGYPGISDPGFRVVADAAAAGHRIEVLPGAGAIEPALIASGLPTSSFTFKGFPPRRSAARRRFLTADADRPHTLVLYESPRRLAGLLTDALATCGDRRAAVCVELTKRFEAVHRGWLSELAEQFAETTVRGEVTVVIAGDHPKFRRSARPPATSA